MRHQEDIIKAVCRDTGFSEELVTFVIADFWKNIHWWLTNPLACGKKIVIEQCIKFRIMPYALGKSVVRAENRPEGDEYIEARIHYLTEVIKQLDKHGQRQASHGINDARYGAYAKRKGQEIPNIDPGQYYLHWKRGDFEPRRESQGSVQ